MPLYGDGRSGTFSATVTQFGGYKTPASPTVQPSPLSSRIQSQPATPDIPTRYYLPATGSAPVDPALSAYWEQTTGYTRHPTSTTKSDTALADGTARTRDSIVSGDDRLDRVYVSAPIGAQTITGTFSAVIAGLESTTDANAWLNIRIRVVSSDGQTERGVLYDGTPNTTTPGAADPTLENAEYNTVVQTRVKSSLALVSVAAVDGDRLVFEVGSRGQSAVATRTVTHRYGDPVATGDFALTGGLTTDLCPWIEFSQTIAASSTPSSVTGTGALTATPAAMSGAATETVSGTGAAAATPATLAASTVVGLTGTGALTATPAAMSGAATETVSGTGALTATPATLTGSGTSRLTGSGVLTATPATLAASGTVIGPVAGTGALTATPATLSSAATLGLTGQGALTGTPATISGSGVARVNGSGAVAALPASLDGSGVVRVVGTGAMAGSPAALSGAATVYVGGSGDLVAPSSSLQASGTLGIAGTGLIAPASPTLDAPGSVTLTGTGSMGSMSPALNGSGTVMWPGLDGAGALTASPPGLSGSATVFVPGAGQLVAAGAQLAGEVLLSLVGAGSLQVAPPSLVAAVEVIQPVHGIGALVAQPGVLQTVVIERSRVLVLKPEQRLLELDPPDDADRLKGSSRTLILQPRERS